MLATTVWDATINTHSAATAVHEDIHSPGKTCRINAHTDRSSTATSPNEPCVFATVAEALLPCGALQSSIQAPEEHESCPGFGCLTHSPNHGAAMNFDSDPAHTLTHPHTHTQCASQLVNF